MAEQRIDSIKQTTALEHICTAPQHGAEIQLYDALYHFKAERTQPTAIIHIKQNDGIRLCRQWIVWNNPPRRSQIHKLSHAIGETKSHIHTTEICC